MLDTYQTISNPARYSRRRRAARTLKLLWTSALLSVCRTRNLVLALVFSLAAVAGWGTTRKHAQTDHKAATASARHAVARHRAPVRAAARDRRVAKTRAQRRAGSRMSSRTRATSKVGAGSNPHGRTSAAELRRAEARRRARREWAERERIRYEARRRRYGRAYLSRDTVHLRPTMMGESQEPTALPSAAELNMSSGDVQPFTTMVSLSIHRGGMPAPLRGSLELLERQDERLRADGLTSIQTEADLAENIADKKLVPIPASDGLTVNGNLKANHRYCRPWTARFLEDLARAHETVFHRPLEVSSAVRPATYQEHLERINGNAAPAEGDIVSPHMMGATIDIAKHGLSRREVAWMRVNLLVLEEAGKIDVEEEFRQACFHITVYPNYAPKVEKTLPSTHTAASPAVPATAPDAAAPAGAPGSEAKPDGGSTALQQDDSTGS